MNKSIIYKEDKDIQEDLRKLEALQQKPCDDCISRQAVQETIFVECQGIKLDIDFAKVLLLQRAIKALPSVRPKEKVGHWINEKVWKLFPSNDYKCSECGNTLDFDGVNCGRGDANYCPNCGCLMKARIRNDRL